MWLTFQQVATGPLAQVSFRLSAGLWLLVGPNGAGKSSLLRCAAGILPPRQGRILWNGTPISTDPQRFRWHVGYAPQEVEEFPDMTAAAYLEYLAVLKGILSAHRSSRVSQLLDLLALPNRKPRTYSTGQKRRLGLAAALLNDPDILILDEPSAGLDIQEKIWLRTYLSDLALDRIVLVATHLPEEMEATGILQVHDGRVNIIDGDHHAGAVEALPR